MKESDSSYQLEKHWNHWHAARCLCPLCGKDAHVGKPLDGDHYCLLHDDGSHRNPRNPPLPCIDEQKFKFIKKWTTCPVEIDANFALSMIGGAPPDGPYNQQRVRCIETNRIYDSVTAAAKSIGRSRAAVHKALRKHTATGNDKTHWEYECKALHPEGAKRNPRPAKIPVRCMDIDMAFPSISEAGRALGINPKYIKKATTPEEEAAGGFRFAIIREQPTKEDKQHSSSKPRKHQKAVVCTKEGAPERVFESIAQTARALDVSDSAVSKAIKLNKPVRGYSVKRVNDQN